MKGVGSIRLPSQRQNVQFAQSPPISIPKSKNVVSQEKNGHLPISNTPPNEFMEHLKKRLNGY
jgi:hypothetical protein